MKMEFNKPNRGSSKMRVAIQGLSFSGKTYTALAIAAGLTGGEPGRVALVDCEGGESELYAEMFNFDVTVMSPPYKPEKYIECIEAAKNAGYDVVILDNISNEWAGDGGLLDDHARLEKELRNKLSSFSAWNDITPRHNAFLSALVRAGIHVIATIKSKPQYVMDVVNGVNTPRKIGFGAVQRDLIDYEFTIYLEMDDNHQATVRKDRTGIIGDSGTVFLPGVDTGEQLRNWLNGDDTVRVPILHTPEPVKKIKTYTKSQVDEIRKTYQERGWDMDVFLDANLNNGKWDAGMIDTDFQTQKALDAADEYAAAEYAALLSTDEQSVPPEQHPKPVTKKHVPEQQADYVCEICGAKLTKSQRDVSMFFNGKCLCQTCQENQK